MLTARRFKACQLGSGALEVMLLSQEVALCADGLQETSYTKRSGCSRITPDGTCKSFEHTQIETVPLIPLPRSLLPAQMLVCQLYVCHTRLIMLH
jgi:hypothetical protein